MPQCGLDNHDVHPASSIHVGTRFEKLLIVEQPTLAVACSSAAHYMEANLPSRWVTKYVRIWLHCTFSTERLPSGYFNEGCRKDQQIIKTRH